MKRQPSNSMKEQNMGDFPNRPTSERLTGSRGEHNDGISTTKEKGVLLTSFSNESNP